MCPHKKHGHRKGKDLIFSCSFIMRYFNKLHGMQTRHGEELALLVCHEAKVHALESQTFPFDLSDELMATDSLTKACTPVSPSYPSET